MSIIKTFHFVSALFIFGIMMYFFMPIVDYIHELFPTTGTASLFIITCYASLPVINLLGSGFRYIQAMQEKEQ